MSDSIGARLTAFAGLLAVLGGLCVLAGSGAIPTAPAPTAGDLLEDYEQHVGDTAQVGGTVVETEPLTIEIDEGTVRPYPREPFRLEVAFEEPPPVEAGDTVVVHGELRPDRTIAADRSTAVVREPWEYRYMYGVSVLGAVLIAARIVDGWRFDARRIAFEPRERPLRTRLRARRRSKPDEPREGSGGA